jgi:predicted HTH transcriptional regulator
MFADNDELLNFISTNSHAESRSCEFKSGVRWEGDFRYKITKGILALSNLAGGGYVIVGVEWNDSVRQYEPIGMEKDTSDTYDHEVVLEFANIRADPFVQIDLKHFEISGKWFVVIQVGEFLDVPVICKKTCTDTNDKVIIENGRIYYRTSKKPESSACLTYVDLREILDHATTKGLSSLLRRLESAGLPLGTITSTPSDEDRFNEESGDFG